MDYGIPKLFHTRETFMSMRYAPVLASFFYCWDPLGSVIAEEPWVPPRLFPP